VVSDTCQSLVQGKRADGYGADARDVDNQFDKFLDGYDSDEIGELEEDDPRIMGHSEIDRFSGILDGFTKDNANKAAKEQYLSAADVIHGMACQKSL